MQSLGTPSMEQLEIEWICPNKHDVRPRGRTFKNEVSCKDTENIFIALYLYTVFNF